MSNEYDEIRQACDENIAAMQRTLTESAVQLAIARDEIVDLTEALTNKYALENEMQVMSDKLTCALLEARENMEIASEFKLTMEEYRQREAAAYIALREAAGLLSTTPKFSSETLDDIFEYLLNPVREKNGG